MIEFDEFLIFSDELMSEIGEFLIYYSEFIIIFDEFISKICALFAQPAYRFGFVYEDAQF